MSGRYTQSDPIGVAYSQHLYAYANANPVVFVDYDGRAAVKYTGLPNKEIQKVCGDPTALGCAKPTFTWHCSCKCIGSSWKPKAWLVVGYTDVYYSTDCYDPKKIKSEELQHAYVYEQSIAGANDKILDFNNLVRDAVSVQVCV